LGLVPVFNGVVGDDDLGLVPVFNGVVGDDDGCVGELD
jgi:hypothetical protein